jgi:hypothetical protein
MMRSSSGAKRVFEISLEGAVRASGRLDAQATARFARLLFTAICVPACQVNVVPTSWGERRPLY